MTKWLSILFLVVSASAQTLSGGATCNGCSAGPTPPIPPPQITFISGNPPNGQTSVLYPPFTIQTTGGQGGITVSLFSGSLPPGLSIVSNQLVGTPSAIGTYNSVVQAADSETPPQTKQQNWTIQITNGVPGPSITSGPPPNGTRTQPYSFNFTANCPAGGCHWTKTGTLPVGLNFVDNGNGTATLGGTPTTVSTYGGLVFTVTDSNSNSASTPTETIVITAPPVFLNNANPPNGTVGLAYSTVTFSATGGIGQPYSFNITGSVPGLFLNSSSGRFGGIPTTAGTFMVSVTASDAAVPPNTSAPVQFTIIISPQSGNVIVLPQAQVNNHEFDFDLAAPAVTENIKSDGSGNHPWTCAGIQAAIADWVADTDKAYLVKIDPGILPATTGTCLTLTPKLGATHFIILQSSNPPTRNQVICAHGLGTGVSGSTRNLGCASPNDAANLWYIQTSSASSNVIDTNNLVDSGGNGPSHFVLMDFQASPTTTVTTANAPVRIGTGAETTAAALPHHIHLQYFYVHGDAGDTFTTGTPPGTNILANDMLFNCVSCSSMWFYFDKSTRPGGEGHGIAIANSVGPLKITNFWIEGNSSGIFHGGQTPSIPNIVSTSDEEVRVGTLTYPSAWIGANFGGTKFTITSISEVGSTVTVTATGIPQNFGTSPVNISMVPVGGYNGLFVATYVSPTTFTYTANSSGLASSSGGTATFGGSPTRKNTFEIKEGVRMLIDGVVGENVDNTGGQLGPCIGIDTRACSAGMACDNYAAVIHDVTISNSIFRSCLGLQNDARSGGATAGVSVSFGSYNFQFFNDLFYNGPGATYCMGSGATGVGSCAPYRWPGITSEQSTWTCTASRDGTTGNITLTCTDGGTGLHQTNILVGDPVQVQGCADVTFNTTLGSIGPAALTGTITTGLTVVYNNASTGAATTTGCTLSNLQGYWNNWQWRHNTVVISSGEAGQTFGPLIGACPITLPNSAYMRNIVIRDNLFALDGWGGFNGNGAAEGSSGAKPAEACFDRNTLQFDHDAYAERSGSNYTAYPSGLPGTSASSNLWFPVTPQCSSTTPSSACIGFSGMLANVFNQNLADYHGYELCGGSGSPAGCAGPSLFAGGQSQQASDGTDVGANIPTIDLAQQLNTYPGFYPSIGSVIFVSPSGSDTNPGSQTLPVATLDKARSLVNGVDGSLVAFAAGFYPETSTSFTSTDSGTSALPIAYNCSNGPCILSGGVKVNGWANCDGVTHCKNLPSGAFTCTGCLTPMYVALSSSTAINFNQLWFNGVRRYRPRSPYTNPSTGVGAWYLQGSPDGTLHETCANTSSAFWPTIGGCPNTGTNKFECFACYQRDPSDTQTVFHGLSGSCTAPGTCTGVHDVEIVAMENWTGSRMRISPSINDGTNSFSLTTTTIPVTGLTTSGASGTPPTATCSGVCNFGPLAGHNYFLDNVLESMTNAQQWYLDRCPSSPTCASGVESTWELIYIPATGENPNVGPVIIPQVNQPIIANSLANVTFSGFTFSYDNFVVPNAGQPGTTDATNIQAAISMRTSTGITFSGDTFANMGHWGLEFIGSPALQTAITNQVINSTMYDIGSGGFRIGQAESTSDTSANVAQFVRIQNVYAQGVQRIMPGEAGCFSIQNAHDNQILNTNCRDTYNLGYTNGGSQGFNGSGHIQAFNNLFSFIECDTVGQGVTSDDACLHSHSGSATGNVLQNFVFHDVVQGIENNSFFTSYNGYSGPYLDNSSSFWTVNHGLSYNGTEGNLLLNSGGDGLGQGNTITNVILAYGKLGLVKRGSSVFTLTNSIGYFDLGNSHNGVQYEGGSQWLCPTTPCTGFTLNSNTWFNFVNSLGAGTPWYITVGGSRTYVSSATWCSTYGEDCGSVFTTNPSFVAPTCAGGYNFNFSGAVPANFTAFALSAVGSTMPQPPSVPAAFPTFVPNCNTYY